jgi:NDP-sugar pyrophosphorylase family protein
MKKNEQLDMTDFFNILKKHKKKIIIYPIYDRWHDIGDKAEYLNIRNNNIF